MISFHDVKTGMIFGTEARLLVTDVDNEHVWGYNFVKAQFSEKGGILKSVYTEETWLKFMRMALPEQDSKLRREVMTKLFTYEIV
jgi:hypothetical protein